MHACTRARRSSKEILLELAALLALIAGISGEPNIPDQFAAYLQGGPTAGYPVTVRDCPDPLGRAEIELETIICGTVNVPEKHAEPDGRRIDLFFTVLRAQSSYPEPDPVLHLHGGPGGGIVSRIELFADIFEPLRRTRDIIRSISGRPSCRHSPRPAGPRWTCRSQTWWTGHSR
ncbi:hypothetical protein [Tropicimonas sp. S265A]|uniref:hypothetical protein n=1 Tax=Tropicimonas sp. S265A TaxID=3415134 RepID=UPI003C7DF559